MFLIVRSFKRETNLNTRNVLLCDTISVLHVDVCGRDYIRCVSLNRHATRVYKQIWSRWVQHASIIQLNRLLLFAAKTHKNLLRDRNQPNVLSYEILLSLYLGNACFLAVCFMNRNKSRDRDNSSCYPSRWVSLFVFTTTVLVLDVSSNQTNNASICSYRCWCIYPYLACNVVSIPGEETI